MDTQLIIAMMLPALLVIFGAAGYRIIEGWPLLDCLYMTIITIATVGFSEVHELSDAGRGFTIFLILSGVISIAYCIQWFVTYMLQKNIFGTLGRRRMEKKIKSLKDHTIVCGYGKIGRHVADSLMAEKSPFIVIDKSLTDNEGLVEKGILFIRGDAADESLLRDAGIDRAKNLVAVVGSDADNLFITMTARGLNTKIKVVARAEDSGNKGKLIRAGADKVVLPYEIGGHRIAAQVLNPSVTDFLETIMSTESLELRMSEIKVGAGSKLNGHSLKESDIRKHTGTIILAIKSEGGSLVTNPTPDTIINSSDKLICLGTRDQIQDLHKLAGGA